MTLRDPGETGGCGSIAVGVGAAVCSHLNFLSATSKFRRRSKAINVHCGLAVLSAPESWCPQGTTGTDSFLCEFPEIAKLPSFSIRSGDVLRQVVRAGLWAWGFCRLLSSFLAKVSTEDTGFPCPSFHVATPSYAHSFPLLVEVKDLKERQSRHHGVYLNVPINSKTRGASAFPNFLLGWRWEV